MAPKPSTAHTAPRPPSPRAAGASCRATVRAMVPAAAPGVVDVNKGQLTEGTPAHAVKSGK